MMHFQLSAADIESLSVDSVIVKMKQGNLSAITDMELFADEDFDQSFNPSLDTYLGSASINGDSTVRFGGSSLDTVSRNLSVDYFLVMNLNSVTFETADELEGRLDIIIDYTISATNTRYNLDYPFYLNEASNP